MVWRGFQKAAQNLVALSRSLSLGVSGMTEAALIHPPASFSFDVRFMKKGKHSVMMYLPEAYHAPSHIQYAGYDCPMAKLCAHLQ